MSEKISDIIFRERYAHYGETKWKDACDRIAKSAALAESKDNYEKWYDEFYYHLSDNYKFLPGGRIICNSGRIKPYLMNCNVIGLDDSRESIGQMLKDILIISGTGGGVGCSFSNLRPEGAEIITNGGYSSGPISFMKCANAVAGVIKIGGGRRAALMLSLSVYHPDIEKFLHVKLDLNELQNANISIEIDNKFIEAVKKNKNWDLIWAGKVWKTIKAKDLWNKIIENAWKSGEPGILNMGLIKDYSNSEYFAPISTTNPCGEIPLPAYESCCLGSVNISQFVKEKNLDIQGFKRAIKTGVRFLDNILTVNEYPLEKIKFNATQSRRIGLGLIGLHYAMLKLGIKYSSKEGVAFTEKVYEILRNQAYWASTELAEEKGAFPKFDTDKYLDNKFVKTLPSKIRDRIRKHGIRNVCLLTQAPTGTTALLAQESSGIEPIFSPVYKRTFRVNDGTDSREANEIIADPLFLKMKEEGKDVSHFEGAHDISPENHLNIQEAAQNYIDSSISKTINLPENYPIDKLSKVLLKYIENLKGVTAYREGSRGNSPLTPLDIDKYLKDVNLEYEDKEATVDCSTGKCDL